MQRWVEVQEAHPLHGSAAWIQLADEVFVRAVLPLERCLFVYPFTRDSTLDYRSLHSRDSTLGYRSLHSMR